MKIRDKDTGRFITGDKILKECLICGSKFYVYPYRKETAKFCSDKCRKIRNPKKNYICSICGKNYLDWAYKGKVHKNHYCSEYCRKHINPKKPIICKFCGNVFYEWDGNRNKKTHKGFFCSIWCKDNYLREAHKGENNPNWLGGKSFEPYTKEFTQSFKLAIRQRDGFMCIKCGMREEDVKILFKRKLICHHIDYIKENTFKENCCALCLRCNTEVNKDRKSWTKFFQSLLSERYEYKYSEDNKIILNIGGKI